MVEIKIQDFGGRLPRRSKRLLPDNYSQECTNAKLLSGELRGFRAPSPVHTFTPGTDPARAWRVRRADNPATDYWVSSSFPEAELLKSPLVNDSLDRWYLFEPGQPPQVASITQLATNTFYDLAFDSPSTAPTLTPTVSDASNVKDVVYVYTYVTEWGEESKPSPPATVSVDDGGSVSVSNLNAGTPSVSGRAYEHKRIYRSITTAGTGDYFFVAEIPYATASYNDTQTDIEVSLNETLSSTTYDQPPSGIYGARVHPSGALVAFKGRNVYFSTPYKPHAWPEDFVVAVDDDIVGIEVWGQNVGVFTKGRPYIVYGTTPSQVGLLRFSMPEPCASYGSIVAAPDGAYYASHQGLVRFTAAGPEVVTRELISKEEWEDEYKFDTMSAARYGTQYICFGRPSNGFVIDILESRVALTDVLFNDPNISTLNEDYYTGDVYAVAGDVVYRWDDSGAEEIDYIWKSKEFVLPLPVNMGAVMVQFEPRDVQYSPPSPLPIQYPPEYDSVNKLTEVLVEIYMNGDRVAAVACENKEQVRLPSGEKGDSWEIRIVGQCRLYSVALTETGRGQGRT
jgi:hypothetical protein